MLQLIYISRASSSLQPQELVELLAQSRNGNDEIGVSGMLLYKDGHFLQVLEGEEAAVRGLAERIARDRRHTNVTFLVETTITVRDFPDWSMGFREDKGGIRLAGYNHFFQSDLSLESFAHQPPLAKELLLRFKNEPLT